jgi:hypothetical protein
MAMNINSSTASTTLRQTPQHGQTQQAAKPAPEPTNEQQQTKAKQAQAAKKPEQPKPVVNAQGQTTGKMIHITA